MNTGYFLPDIFHNVDVWGIYKSGKLIGENVNARNGISVPFDSRFYQGWEYV